MSDPRNFHSRLKEIASRYGRAIQDFDRAMYRGDADRADDALAEMQTIERSVTIITMPGTRK